MRRTAKQQGLILPSRILYEFSTCVDLVFFGTSLMSRVDIFWTTSGALRSVASGMTSFRTMCDTYRQVHSVYITLDPYRWPGEPISEWRERVLSTLRHECLHRYLYEQGYHDSPAVLLSAWCRRPWLTLDGTVPVLGNQMDAPPSSNPGNPYERP